MSSKEKYDHPTIKVMSIVELRTAEPISFNQQIVVTIRLQHTCFDIRNAFLISGLR